ncbi:MAG: Type II secretion system F domain protein [Candidatus Amesbacteria bacterium GW2011_GWC2_47_8]|uniref:Type II secretion system F domain protein n=1 Tax=Candidatus Amesbacteria bacterium GW2011_GWC2_47_8 TaxID=1618367 RepID=A0A0G1VYX4_9BACT|nr:MAG: Type II secretion system F domain protein [Candidatus Amesbacteria bacterium GW2011_GWC2_47_8]
MKFRYKARDPHGLEIKGAMEAPDAKSAAAMLRDKKLLVISVSRELAEFNFGWGRVNPSEVTNFTRQLATMINAGLPITDALNLLRLQAGPALAPAVEQIMGDVQAGVSLSEAMSKHPKLFSKVYVALVKAGETAGVVETILTRLSDTLEKGRVFKGKVVAVMILMMVVVIPKLTEVYRQFDSQLPLATRIVVGVSDVFMHYWLLIAIGVFGAVGVMGGYMKTAAGRRWWDRLVYKFPVMGSLAKETMLTELTRTLALLVGSGVAIVEALNIVAGAVGNVIVEAEMRTIAKRVEKGFPLAVSFAEADSFPPIVGQMIAVGEETGKLDDVLAKLSTFFESESEQKVKNLTTALEPVILIVMALGVGFLMYAIIMPIYGITNKL